MATTIQISQKLQDELSKRKLFERETYEEIIWDIMEDSAEISEETKAELQKSREEIQKGEFVTLSEAKKQLRL